MKQFFSRITHVVDIPHRFLGLTAPKKTWKLISVEPLIEGVRVNFENHIEDRFILLDEKDMCKGDLMEVLTCWEIPDEDWESTKKDKLLEDFVLADFRRFTNSA